MIKRLKLVEIELFSYCNRRCDWCPNREIDRHSSNIQLKDSILADLLSELATSKYQGAISFSRYNEPMSDIETFKNRLDQVRASLPHNKLITNTNGDFISRSNLNDLPIDELTVMDYDMLGLDRCLKKLTSSGAVVDEINYPYIYAYQGSMSILYFVDWPKIAAVSDRGGFLQEYSKNKRIVPCYEPLYFAGINYDGTVSPCCNIRNDTAKSRQYVLGDLYSRTLAEILAGEKARAFRDDCADARFEADSPCYFCANEGGRYTQGKGFGYE